LLIDESRKREEIALERHIATPMRLSAEEGYANKEEHEHEHDDDEEEHASFLERLLREREYEKDAQHMANRKKMLQGVERIRSRVRDLVNRNASLGDLERMDRREFVVDVASELALLHQTIDEIEHAKEDIRVQNVSNDIIYERVKEECLGEMEYAGCVLHGFNTGCEVPSIVIRKLTQEESAAIESAKAMRRLEHGEAHERPKAAAQQQQQQQQQQQDGGHSETRGLSPDMLHKPYLQLEHPLRTPALALLPRARSSVKRSQSIKPSPDAADELGDEVDDIVPEAPKAAVEHQEREGDLLYHIFSLTVPTRQHLQIELLKSYIRDMQRGFNQHFEDLREHKQEVIDALQEKNVRLSEIVAELKSDTEEGFKVIIPDDERPESVLEVKDEEMSVPKPITEMEKLKNEQQRNKHGKAGEPLMDGLIAMMDGTLEPKKEEAQGEMGRPEWMDAPLESLTEEQNKLLKEYEAKDRTRKEEREKQRKALEAEAKKVRGEMREIQDRFDERLHQLFHLKAKVDQAVFEQELIIIKLSLSLLRHEMYQNKIAVLTSKVQSIKRRKAGSFTQLNTYKREVEDVRERYDGLVAEDRGLDKAFKKDFAEYEPLTEQLYRLFKRRSRKGGYETTRTDGSRSFAVLKGLMSRSQRPSIRPPSPPPAPSSDAAPSPPPPPAPSAPTGHASSKTQRHSVRSLHQTWSEGTLVDVSMAASAVMMTVAPSALVSGDPFANVTLLDAGQISDPTTTTSQSQASLAMFDDRLDRDRDRPEGIDDVGWERLVEARVRKMELEAEVKRQGAVLEGMNGQMKQLLEEDESVRNEMDRLMSQLSEANESAARHMLDIDVLFKIKQGQLEAVSGPVVMDMTDCVLVHRSIVSELNDKIKQHNAEKIQELETIKDLRKGIHMLKWENSKLDMDIEDWITRTRDLQLLRVTKSLQKVIKGGEDKRQQEENAMLERRLDHAKQSHEYEVRKKRDVHNKLEIMVEEKLKENNYLMEEIDKLETAVNERAQLTSLQGSEAVERVLRDKKMLHIIQCRQLREQAQLQSMEMDLLNAELARIKRRTFPIFQPIRPPLIVAAAMSTLPLPPSEKTLPALERRHSPLETRFPYSEIDRTHAQTR